MVSAPMSPAATVNCRRAAGNRRSFRWRQAAQRNNRRDRLPIPNDDDRLVFVDHRFEDAREELTRRRRIHRFHVARPAPERCTNLFACTVERIAAH